MTTRKPALPPKDHIEIAQSIAETIATAGDGIVETLPPKVRESLDYFDEVTRVAADINTVQAEMLRPYATEMAQTLVDTGEFDSTAAALAVLTLFKSHEMARLLADVAAGVVEPVAVASVKPKTKTSSRSTAKKSASAPAKPAAKKASPRRKPEPKPEPVAAPVVETPTAPETPAPVDEVPVDPFDAPIPDDPFLEDESPAPAPPVPTSRPAPVGAGSRFAQDPDDDF